jgi:hypothetical protein
MRSKLDIYVLIINIQRVDLEPVIFLSPTKDDSLNHFSTLDINMPAN